MPREMQKEITSEILPDEAPQREPNYKVAFEVAANQRDKANQQLCNMQIDLALVQSDKEALEKTIAELQAENKTLRKKAA